MKGKHMRVVISVLLAWVFVWTVTAVPPAGAQVCSEERVVVLTNAGLSDDEINTICPQRECSQERVDKLKATGLNDCEVGNLCPGYIEQRADHLRKIGLSEQEIGALMPGCFESSSVSEPRTAPTPAVVQPTPRPVPVAKIATPPAGEAAPVISESNYSGGNSGYGQVNVKVVIGSDDDAIDAAAGLLSVGVGIWYYFEIFLDNNKVHGGRSIGSQDFLFKQDLPVGKHAVKVTARQMAALILPGPKLVYETTLPIREGRVASLKIPADYFFKDINKPEELDTELGGG